MAPRKRPDRRPRRKPGTGSVRFKKGRALPYEAAFPLGHGQYRYDSFHTAAEADAYLDQLVVERDRVEAPRNIAAGSERVDQFLPTWLLIKRPHIKPKTFVGYQYYCELAMGEIGGLRLDSVRRNDAELMLAFFASRGFKNVKEMRMVLNQAFQYAEDEQYITSNPFKKAKAPAVEHRQAIALTRGQRSYLLRCAVEEDDPTIPLYPIWHLYSRLGLRKGEGLGLAWGRNGVDLDTGMLTISQQYTNVGNQTVKSTPKTKKSRRTIPIPADLLDILRRHYTAQCAHAAADPEWDDHNLVFCNAHGGPLTYWHVPMRWARLKKRAGLSDTIRLHDLRHTALYLMEQDGTPQSVRMALAGHSAVAMASHYAEHAAGDLDALRAAVARTA